MVNFGGRKLGGVAKEEWGGRVIRTEFFVESPLTPAETRALRNLQCPDSLKSKLSFVPASQVRKAKWSLRTLIGLWGPDKSQTPLLLSVPEGARTYRGTYRVETFAVVIGKEVVVHRPGVGSQWSVGHYREIVRSRRWLVRQTMLVAALVLRPTLTFRGLDRPCEWIPCFRCRPPSAL